MSEEVWVDLSEAGGDVSKNKGSDEDSVSEKENNSFPVIKVRKEAVNKTPVVETTR